MYRVKGADQKEYGPVSAEQVTQWIGENRLNRFSLLQKEGEATWKPLDQFPEFASLLGAATPPPVAPAAGGPGGFNPAQVFPTANAADPGAGARAAQAPAIAMMVVAGLSALYSVYQLVSVMSMPMDALMKQIEQQSGQQWPAALPVTALKSMIVGGALVPLLLSALILFAGLSFLRLKNRGLALTGAIMLLIPCCGTSGICCLIGLPIGIWAVLTLNKPEVKAAFR